MLDARFDATLFALHPDMAILSDTEPTQRYAAPDCNRDAEADFSVPLDAKHYGMTAHGCLAVNSRVPGTIVADSEAALSHSNPAFWTFCVPLEPDAGVPCSDDLINLESAQLVGR